MYICLYKKQRRRRRMNRPHLLKTTSKDTHTHTHIHTKTDRSLDSMTGHD